MSGDRDASISQRILEVLKAHPEGIDIHGVRNALGLDGDEHQHLDRRLRALDPFHHIDRKKDGTKTLYFYVSEKPAVSNAPLVSKTTRARILYRDGSRCQMCGKTVLTDNVRLHIDHRVPQEWGGANDDDNLWALCSECNEGKKAYFATITDPTVREALLHKSIHVRIGELLRLNAGKEISKDLIQIVASTHDDWEKRMRELRELGWDYETHKRKENGKVRVYFKLLKWEPWPVDPAAAIRLSEKRRR